MNDLWELFKKRWKVVFAIEQLNTERSFMREKYVSIKRGIDIK